ncbi:hypothetical protein D3C81_1646610 [compost metagenome]
MDPAIAVPHGVDVYKGEGKRRCPGQRLGASLSQLERLQPIEQPRQGLEPWCDVVHDVFAHGRLSDEDR